MNGDYKQLIGHRIFQQLIKEDPSLWKRAMESEKAPEINITIGTWEYNYKLDLREYQRIYKKENDVS